MPNDEEWQELAHTLEYHPAKWMIWEGNPLGASAEKLKALGVGSVVFSPCANVPEKGDFLSVMKTNLAQLKRAF